MTREVRGQITRTPAGERLRTIPGIDYILAYTILAEVGRIERFRSAKHLGSYSLLAPRAYDSGDDDGEAPKGRHVGHAGRRTLKWAWIEAAHGAVRKGGRFREIFDRRTNGEKRDRNRGYIAVGHELCRTAYAMWAKEVDYSETPPPRPGRRKRRLGLRRAKNVTFGTSRPGTGQSEHPMVAVPTSVGPSDLVVSGPPAPDEIMGRVDEGGGHRVEKTRRRGRRQPEWIDGPSERGPAQSRCHGRERPTGAFFK